MMQDAHLADLLTFTRDGEWGKGEPTDGFSPALVIRGTDFERVRAGQLGTLPLRYIRSDILGRKAIVAGDTLIETAGGTKDQPTGRSVFIPKAVLDAVNYPLICASFARFLRPEPSQVVPEFLFWKLQDEYHSRRMMPYHIQHTGVARFQYTQFATRYPLALPILPKQRTIAATLGALDDKIELNRRMNETLEAMARALFRDWFVDFGPTRAKMAGTAPYLSPDLWALFPDSLDDAGNPEGWAIKKVGDAFDITIGRTPPRKEPKHFVAGGMGVPWLSIKTMGDGKLFAFGSEEDLTLDAVRNFRVRVAPVGSVLLSFKLTVGRVVICGVPMCTNEAIAHFVCDEKSMFSTEYTYLALKTFDYSLLGSTSSIATAVNSASVRSIPFLYPGEGPMRAFTQTIMPIFERICSNVEESRTLAQTRDLLLPRLMSGELRVAGAERAVEALL